VPKEALARHEREHTRRILRESLIELRFHALALGAEVDRSAP
jgi:hypothetical protein